MKQQDNMGLCILKYCPKNLQKCRHPSSPPKKEEKKKKKINKKKKKKKPYKTTTKPTDKQTKSTLKNSVYLLFTLGSGYVIV